MKSENDDITKSGLDIFFGLKEITQISSKAGVSSIQVVKSVGRLFMSFLTYVLRFRTKTNNVFAPYVNIVMMHRVDPDKNCGLFRVIKFHLIKGFFQKEGHLQNSTP